MLKCMDDDFKKSNTHVCELESLLVPRRVVCYSVLSLVMTNEMIIPRRMINND